MDLAGHWVALWVEETKNQTESQHIKPNIGFLWEGKTRVPGEKPLLKNWVEKQQSQPTYQYVSMGQEITLGHIGGRRVLSPLRQPYSKIDDEHDNDSNNNKTQWLGNVTTSSPIHWAWTSTCIFTCIHIVRTRVHITHYSSSSGNSQQDFRAK